MIMSVCPRASSIFHTLVCTWQLRPKVIRRWLFFDAIEMVNREKDSDVPDHLKDGQRDKQDFGHGKGYIYPHAYRDHWVAQQYLPSSLQGKMFYEPSDMGHEKEIKERVMY